MAANTLLKKKLATITASVEPEKEWWEAKKATTKEDFMRELDKDAMAEKKEHAAATQTARAPTVQAEKMTRSQSSDGSEEAVLVETPAHAAAGGGGGGGGGGGKGKKKKGKK
jgi:hypothetical protein